MRTNKSYTSNQMLVINMAASAITYLVTFGINFVLSPYIVRTVGVEAYGFVGLANNFISYASLATVALNALSGRFITIRLYEKDIEGANKYYTSVFFANLAIGLLILLVETVVWLRLDNLIHIPRHIFWDVKILFGALFLNCILSTVGSVFGIATFATNKLYLSSLRSIESSLIRAVVLIILFLFFAPHVWYLGATSLLTGIYCLFFNIHYTHILTPELQIRKKYFDYRAVKELLSSGVWSLVNRLGTMLLVDLDLLITNLFIDVTSMGVLSLAKTIPSMIQSIIGTMANVFSPNFTILYAEGKKDELIKSLFQSMKIMGVLTNLPIVVLAVCGEDFFNLWQPTQNAHQLQILSLLTIAGFIINGGVNCIFNIFTVINKLKVNSIAIVVSGFMNTIITYLVIKNTSFGVYAVAGISTIIALIRNLAVSIPYAAICVDMKWYSFYPYVFRAVFYFILSVLICAPLSSFILAENWVALSVKGVIVTCISLGIGFFVVLNKEDRVLLINKINRKARR